MGVRKGGTGSCPPPPNGGMVVHTIKMKKALRGDANTARWL